MNNQIPICLQCGNEIKNYDSEYIVHSYGFCSDKCAENCARNAEAEAYENYYKNQPTPLSDEELEYIYGKPY